MAVRNYLNLLIMPSENSQEHWILTMNTKQLIYLSLFLGTTCFNPSHAADPLDTVTDGNVRQLCERYHITEFKKTECLTGYQQVQQERLLCEASELSKSQCLSRYNELLEQWKRGRRGDPIVIHPPSYPRPPSLGKDEPPPPDDPPDEDELWYNASVKNHPRSQELCGDKRNAYKSCLMKNSEGECRDRMEEELDKYESCLNRGGSAEICAKSPDWDPPDEAAARILKQYKSCLEYHRAEDCRHTLR